MKKIYTAIIFCLCIFHFANGQAPSFVLDYQSPIVLNNPIPNGTYETVSNVYFENTGTNSNQVDFECDLYYNGSLCKVIGKSCGWTIAPGFRNVSPITFDINSIDANMINCTCGTTGNYTINFVVSYSSCLPGGQCGTHNSSCISQVASGGYNFPYPVTISGCSSCTAPYNGLISPGNPTVTAPSPINLTVSASGTPPFTYQWWIWNGSTWVALTNSSPYSGTTTATMTIDPTATGMTGNYYTCVVCNNCSGQQCQTNIPPVQLTVNGSSNYVTSSFSYNVSCQGQTSYFYDGSSGSPSPNYWNWTFGDGNSSNSQNPSHMYSSSGYYNVSLFVQNSTGNNNISTQQIYVPSSSVSTNFNYTPGYSGFTTSFYDASNYGCGSASSWSWNFGDGFTSTSQNPSHIYSTSGNFYVTLTAYNDLGNSNFYSQWITINAPPVTVTVNGSPVVAPWQRANESYSVTMNATTSDNSQWQIVAHDMNGNNSDQYSAFANSGSTISNYTFTFSNPTSAIVYYAQNLSGSISSTISSQTEIIEKKWDSKNVVYYNFVTEGLNIPVKYVPGTTSIKITITKDNLTSHIHDNILTGPFLSQSGNTQQHFILDYSNSNLENVSPGEFVYTLDYMGSGFSETGRIDFTKVGRVKTSIGNTKIIVLIGGLINDMETDAVTLRTSPISTNWASSDLSFSLGPYLNDFGFDIWYIGQGSTNLIKKNGYDIGIGLEKIKELNPNCTEIDLIGHSKGGLDIRALMAQPNSLTQSLNGNTFDFNQFQSNNNNIVKKVLFLGTPHRGAIAANLFYIITYLYHDLASTPAYQDLIVDLFNNPSNTVNQLNQSPMPLNIEFANLTGYINFYTMNDFIVQTDESEFPFIGPGRNAIQFYQNDSRIIFYPSIFRPWFHMRLHKTFYLTNNHSSDCTNGESNIEKISDFFSPSGYNLACNYSFTGGYTFYATGSVLANASIHLKLANDSINYFLGSTDELGFLNIKSHYEFSIGDTLFISASGKESLIVPIDSQIINTKSVLIPMIKSLTPSTEIEYPSLKLVNHSPITNLQTIDIQISAINASSYEINTPFNQDSIFTPINAGINTIQLDTGLNQVIIRFIGNNIDTLIKNIYYLPDTLMNMFTDFVTVNADSTSLGSELFINQEFYRQVDSNVIHLNVLKGDKEFKFSKFGYAKSTYLIDSTATINSYLTPIFYSLFSDSSIVDFSAQGKIQYRKNVTVLDSAQQTILSLKQYDDNFSTMGLIPKSRKFEMRHLNGQWSDIRFASVLDQIENLTLDSIYIMRIYDDTSFTKLQFDAGAIVAGYDSIVQKLSYNYINFNNGTALKEALNIMKKQAPIVTAISTININAYDSLTLPLSSFFSDPDSIHNDLTYQLGAFSSQLNIQMIGDSVIIHALSCSGNPTNFSLIGYHDGLSSTNVVSINIQSSFVATITPSGSLSFCDGDSVTLISSPATTYLWNNGSTSQSITTLVSGTFNVTITNSSGCSAISSPVNVTFYQKPQSAISASNGGEFCIGDSSICSVLFQPNCIYQWTFNGMTISGGTNSSYTAFQGGWYECFITDTVTGCIGDLQSTLILDEQHADTTVYGLTAMCFGDSVTLAVNMPPYANNGFSINWNEVGNPIPFPSGDTSYTFNSPGYYYVVISGMFCWDTTAIVHIIGDSQIFSTALPTNLTCYGTNTGAIAITASGGTPPFQYSLDGITYQALNTFNNLPDSIYIVYVKDSFDCILAQNVTVTEPLPVVSSILSQTMDDCFPGGSGTLTLSASGGVGSYQYSINNGATFQSNSQFSNLNAGPYSVIVQDANGCTSLIVDTILQTPPQNGLVFTINNDTLISPYDSSQWYFVGDTIPFAIGNTVICIDTGNIYVIGFDSNGCLATSIIGYDSCSTTVGILSQNYFGNSFTIHPNPTSGSFIIEFTSDIASKEGTIEMINSLGQSILKFQIPIKNGFNSQVIDLSNFPTGIYFVNLNTGSGTYRQKLIKE